MITKTTGYASSDGVLHATVEEAQRAELEGVFNDTILHNVNGSVDTACCQQLLRAIVNTTFERSDDLIAILTTGPRSRPKARKSAGTTSPRRAARKASSPPDKATTEQASEGFKTMREAVDNPPDATV